MNRHTHRTKRSGRWQRLAGALPVLATLIVVVGVGGFVIVEQQRQVKATQEADTVAEAFDAEADAFLAELTEIVEAGRSLPPAELQAQVQARIAEPPHLAEFSGEGVESSSAYRDAQYREATMLDPYVELVDVLGRAALARDFIAAAQTALALRIEDILGTTTIRDPAVVTGQVIPAFEQALATFEEVPVPGGQEELAQAVSAAVQNVIDQSQLLVNFAALGQNYSFSYGEQIAEAQEAVRLYGLTVDADVATAIDAVLPE
ncbi:MAG: hypothetical protein QM597_00195 [Aeromicrobium sp.]|uniref:hypothetical protein n=1 Tax=Aeromicrobium sp. TaxID=1871063 RepID=UPI0039E59B4F